MDYLKNELLPNVASSVASSVKDKLLSTARSYVCGNNNNDNNMRMNKRLGVNKAEITRMGVSNQKIKRRMGV
jgi:hypothetical protein